MDSRNSPYQEVAQQITGTLLPSDDGDYGGCICPVKEKKLPTYNRSLSGGGPARLGVQGTNRK